MSLRELAAQDPHARDLAELSDRWFEVMHQRTGLVVRETDTGSVAVVVDRLACPADPEATARIRYWAVDYSRNLAVELAKSSLQALEEAESLGSPKIWGAVAVSPLTQHLSGFLDLVVMAGACERLRHEDYPDHVFYVAPVAPARRYMEAASRG